MRPITHIVIHCSATPASMDIGRKEIDAWHREKGWAGIGYHYVIRRDGTRETGRAELRMGAHVEGHNKNSIGVCLVGGVKRAGGKLVTENNFTPAQWAALEKIVRELHRRYPEAKIVGHRDLNRGKDCPSFSVRDWLAGTTILADGIAWDSGVDKPKPMAKEPTAQGAALATAGTLGATLTDASNQVAIVADYSTSLRIVFVVLTLAGIALTIYGQLQKRRQESA